MIDPRWEEQAALAALGWSDDPAGLDRAAAQDPEIAAARREFAEAAATLAYDAPPQIPPPALRARIMAAVEAQAAPAPVAVAKETFDWTRLFAWPRLPLMPYALAACLMGVALLQAGLILLLDSRLDSSRIPGHHDPFSGVQLVGLAPQGDHGPAKVMVAWNAKTSSGMLTLDDMPPAPPGNDYQLWVLDPSKPAPVNAGVVPHGTASRQFIAGEVHLPGRPGFALSLEKEGGAATPSSQILFAVAPSP